MKKAPIKVKKLTPKQIGAHVRENLKMYWGTEYPTTKHAIDALKEQLLILKSRNILSFKYDEWNFLGAENDWIESGLKQVGTLENLFMKGAAFPEAGGFSLRSEFFIYEFSTDLILWRENKVSVLKGNVDIDIEPIFKQHFPKGVAISFRGNSYTNEA